jgi:hypothetical protein
MAQRDEPHITARDMYNPVAGCYGCGVSYSITLLCDHELCYKCRTIKPCTECEIDENGLPF